METGIRGEFWVKAMRYFKDSPYVTDEVVDAFYSCLVEHAEFLIQMHSPYRYMSNWGVIENHGLFEIGIAMPKKALYLYCPGASGSRGADADYGRRRSVGAVSPVSQ